MMKIVTILGAFNAVSRQVFLDHDIPTIANTLGRRCSAILRHVLLLLLLLLIPMRSVLLSVVLTIMMVVLLVMM